MSVRPLHRVPPDRPWGIAIAATAVVSAAAGWFARGPEVPAPAALSAVGQPATPDPARLASRAFALPLIAVSSDGNVTLRVEQQPLDWVLEQISLQADLPDLKQRTYAAAAAHAAASAAATPATPAAATPAIPAASAMAAEPVLLSCSESAARQVDPLRIVQSIESGTEAERFQGLMLARSAEVQVGEATLKRLYENGGSERVEVAAFEAYLALHADRPDALRAALEAAQSASTATIQRQAARRLLELHEVERLNALPPLADP